MTIDIDGQLMDHMSGCIYSMTCKDCDAPLDFVVKKVHSDFDIDVIVERCTCADKET